MERIHDLQICAAYGLELPMKPGVDAVELFCVVIMFTVWLWGVGMLAITCTTGPTEHNGFRTFGQAAMITFWPLTAFVLGVTVPIYMLARLISRLFARAVRARAQLPSARVVVR